MKFYTGIGSRETPEEILNVMKDIAHQLASKNYTLRSGGADGADLAFELGAGLKAPKEIYLPWKGFNGSKSNLYNPSISAMFMASEYHPNWNNLSKPIRKLMGRNSHQVLGRNLEIPSEFVICWTPDGCETHGTRSKKTGGTGQAISLAYFNDIPVYNLKNNQSLKDIQNKINNICLEDKYGNIFNPSI